MKHKFSIVTITKNNKSGLARTLESIRAQTSRDFELIIVDGNSVDGTEELLQEYREIIGSVLRDRGAGIYAAMNQGALSAKGEWLIFMNAGDCFAAAEALQQVDFDPSAQIVHGNAYKRDSTLHLPYDEKIPFWMGMPISHQATFFRRTLLERRLFDESFRIAADFEYLMWAKTSGCRFEYIDVDIATIEIGGVSETKIVRRVWETYHAAVRYFPYYRVHRFYWSKLWWAFKTEMANKRAGSRTGQ